MNVLDARLCLLLHRLSGLGDRPLSRLFLRYGSAQKIWESGPGDWSALGVSAGTIREAMALRERGLTAATSSPIEQQLNVLLDLGAEVISLTDHRYPALLRTLYDPPPILYVLGDAEVLQQAQMGIVGSRKASPSGRRAALELSAECVRAGLHVCSGLAVGIDEAAHRGALDAALPLCAR